MAQATETKAMTGEGRDGKWVYLFAEGSMQMRDLLGG